jgi:AcrR family transcriptional regulator
VSSAESTSSGGRGRPRLEPRRRKGASAAEEILDAAAELFTTRGYAGTSTRMIAEAVGIRQASLYHHFATKDDILAALLEQTVSAALGRARELAVADGPAVDRLCELVRFDADQLASARWNLGALYLLPELGADRFAEFRSARSELAVTYEKLAAEAIGRPDDPLQYLPLRLVESVINLRSDNAIADRAIADRAIGGRGRPDRAEVVDAIVAATRRIVGG